MVELKIESELHYISGENILQARKCVLLNSRQSKRPSRRDKWIQATKEAVEHFADDCVFLTSIGMNTWELALHLVNECGGRQIIVIPAEDGINPANVIDSVNLDFKLDPARVGFVFFNPSKSIKRSRKSCWLERDRIIVDLADTIVPVSVRSGGNLESIIAAAAVEHDKHVEARFAVEYRPAADRVTYNLNQKYINPRFAGSVWDYVTHWTRSSHTPYAGESSLAYYHDIINSDRYPRTASDTLARIVSERRIRASSRFIRGGYEVVSFTSLNPINAVKLMRWRRRYVYYSFEPYGIAIARSYVARISIKPVIYGDSQLYEQLSDEERPFFQNRGSGNADWRPEAEFRHLGDLSLGRVPADQVKLIVYRPADAERFADLCPYEVIPLVLM